MALELRYEPGSHDSYKIPEGVVIVYKGVTYVVAITMLPRREDTTSSNMTLLTESEEELGTCDFIAGKPLDIKALVSYNMLDEGVVMIKYARAIELGIRNKPGRIPVGTILIETLKQIAKLNGNTAIRLVSMPDAQTFYKTKGFTLISDSPAIYEYKGNEVSSSAAATKSRKNKKTRRSLRKK